MQPKLGKIIICPNCGKEKYYAKAIIERGEGKFCSLQCVWKFNIGNKSYRWKGGIHHDNRGYISIYKPEHPKSMFSYVYEHILVMEEHIGRYLKEEEQVHHINKNKGDNRIINLLLCPNTQFHSRIENGWKFKNNKWFKICSGCKEEKEVNIDNFYQRKTGKFVNICKKCCTVEYKEKKLKSESDNH